MTTTFGKIIGSREALTALSKERLAIKQAVALSRLIRRLDEELRVFEDQRKKLLEQYGTEQEGAFTIAPEKRADFEAKLHELLNLTVELEGEKLHVTPERVSAQSILSTEDFVLFEEGD